MFSFYNPKKAHHCAIPRLLSVKIRPGVSSLRRSEKINKKSHKKLYFTPLPRSPPWTDFYQIWKKYVPLVHVVNSDKLCVSLFKGFDFTGGQNFHFPIGNWRRRFNSAALPYGAACDSCLACCIVRKTSPERICCYSPVTDWMTAVWLLFACIQSEAFWLLSVLWLVQVRHAHGSLAQFSCVWVGEEVVQIKIPRVHLAVQFTQFIQTSVTYTLVIAVV